MERKTDEGKFSEQPEKEFILAAIKMKYIYTGVKDG